MAAADFLRWLVDLPTTECLVDPLHNSQGVGKSSLIMQFTQEDFKE